MILAGHQLGPTNGQAWADYVKANPEFPPNVDRLLKSWRRDELASLLVLQVERDGATKPLIGPVMAARVTAHDMGTLKLADIIDDPDRYTQLLLTDLHGSFFEQLTHYNNFWKRIEEAGLAVGAIRIFGHLITKEVKAEVRKQARSVLLAALKAVEAGKWVEAIEEDEEPLATAQWLKEQGGVSVALGLPLFEALNQLMPELIASEDRPYASTWFPAAGLLGKTHRQTLFRNLRDHLLGIAAPPRLYDLLRAGGTALIEGGDFAAKSDECVRHFVLPGLTEQGLPWLLEQQEVVKGWMSKASSETVEVAREKALSSLDELEGEDRTRLELLMKRWG
jgi:hypothetical protein